MTCCLASSLRNGLRNNLGDWLALQTALFTLSLPLQLFWFGAVSWLSIPANLLVAPLLSLLFGLCVFAGMLCFLSERIASWIFAGCFFTAEKLLVGLSECTYKLDWRWCQQLQQSHLALLLPPTIAALVYLLAVKDFQGPQGPMLERTTGDQSRS